MKRPDRLLDLAEICQDLHFDFVGPPADTEYVRNVCERAKTMSNVTFHGPAPRIQVSEFYSKAAVMCCTSDFEGFPNTFLEAWSYGLPIVTTFDPDNLVSERGLGKVGSELSELVTGLRSLLDDSKSWQKASDSARQYYLQNHSVDKAMERFENVFIDTIDLA